MLIPSIEQRLATLKTEFEAGQKLLVELEAKQTNVRETLFRISGAIQVLEELLTEVESTQDLSNGMISNPHPTSVSEMSSLI
jgi:hypothetical protein